MGRCLRRGDVTLGPPVRLLPDGYLETGIPWLTDFRWTRMIPVRALSQGHERTDDAVEDGVAAPFWGLPDGPAVAIFLEIGP